MSKIRTLGDLQDALDKSFGWRVREISYVKSNAKKAESFAQVSYIRAGIPLVYAHWEGFVKESSEAYLEYVDSHKLNYEELASCIVVFGLKKQIADLVQSRRSVANIEAVDFIRRSKGKVANLALSNAVNTESNLSSEVFFNIAASVGVDVSRYSTYANFLNKSLLGRRNKIAHGEYLDADWLAFEEIVEKVLLLLRMYKTDVENLASTGAFKVK